MMTPKRVLVPLIAVSTVVIALAIKKRRGS